MSFLRTVLTAARPPLRLDRVRKDHTEDAFAWVCLTVVFGLMPVWVGYLMIVLFFSRVPALVEFTRKGEFALYSASILSGIIYVSSRESIKKRFRAPEQRHLRLVFPCENVFRLGSVILIFLAVLLYFVPEAISLLPNSATGTIFNVDFMHYASLVLYVFSLVLGFIVTLVANVWDDSVPDLKKTQEAALASLNTQFDALGGERQDG